MPEIDTGTLFLATLPDWFQMGESEAGARKPSPDVRFPLSGAQVLAREGRYFRIQTPDGRLPVIYLNENDGDRDSTSDLLHDRSAFVIPRDEYIMDRTETLLRLCRLAKGLRSPDNRLTPGQRLRLRQMLQAVDGDDHGASGPEIAKIIYGRSRDKGRAWYESTYRFRVHRLIEDGRAMIAHGYRFLLRPKRRK